MFYSLIYFIFRGMGISRPASKLLRAKQRGIDISKYKLRNHFLDSI
uniref:Uncharacterized protein n=1 Tax=Anguilla anguilla TaxID=7936 RepID=A0A0E9QLV4_ANGAN